MYVTVLVLRPDVSDYHKLGLTVKMSLKSDNVDDAFNALPLEYRRVACAAMVIFQNELLRLGEPLDATRLKRLGQQLRLYAVRQGPFANTILAGDNAAVTRWWQSISTDSQASELSVRAAFSAQS